MNGCGAEVDSIYRQPPKVQLPPANPHECWRIASKFTVRPNFAVTANATENSAPSFDRQPYRQKFPLASDRCR
jgi:hypothetical protein